MFFSRGRPARFSFAGRPRPFGAALIKMGLYIEMLLDFVVESDSWSLQSSVHVEMVPP